MAIKKINETIRQKILEAHTSGLPMRKIARECGVSVSSVHRIVIESGTQKVQKKITKKMSKTEKLKRIEKLEKRIAELEKKILDIE